MTHKVYKDMTETYTAVNMTMLLAPKLPSIASCADVNDDES